MAQRSVRSGLRDVAPGIPTPFDGDLEVDYEALTENARVIYDRGIRTFLACGNISEYHSLSHDERIAVTEASVEALPSDTTILAGAGGSTKTTTDLATTFEDIGVDAIMVMPPDHTFKHESGLLGYYRKVGDAVDTPLVPYIRGFEPSVDFMGHLTHLDSVVGIKWALENIQKFTESRKTGPDDVVWINGLGEPHAPAFYVEGAEGMAAAVGNFEPAISLALLEALEEDQMDRARAIRDVTIPYMNFRYEKGESNTFPAANSVPAVKAGLDFSGLTGGLVREPLVNLSEKDYERAREYYDTLVTFMEEEL